MVNWHRKLWVVAPTLENQTGTEANDDFFKDGATNEFWLEPAPAPDGVTLCFTVGSQPGQLEHGWQDWVLFPAGETPFDPDAIPTPDTERLAGTRIFGGVERELRLYVEAATNDAPEKMHIELGFPEGDGADGIAVAHPE
jgi:hypothetical protein